MTSDSTTPIETTPVSATPIEPTGSEWTPEQLAAFQAWSAGYGEQDENGIDLSLIRSNLKLTPLERVRLGDRARRMSLELQEIGQRQREQIVARKMP